MNQTLNAQLAALSSEEHRIKEAQQSAEVERDQASLELARRPNDADCRERLEEREAELAGYARDFERLAGARRALLLQADTDTEQARIDRFDAARAAVPKLSSARVEAVARAEQALRMFAQALLDEAKARTACWEAVIAVAHAAHGQTVESTQSALALQGNAVGGMAPLLSQLNSALQSAAALGGRLHQAVTVLGFTDPQPRAAEAAQVEHERLLRQLTAFTLASSKAEV